MSNRLLAYSRKNADARLRLFCLPYAGGSASIYRAWPEAFPESIEVCPIELPGRGARFTESLHNTMEPLVREVADTLVPYLDRPFALFGYSMGALIAFELAHALRRNYGLNPVHLCASAHRAPQIPDLDSAVHDLPEPQFWETLRGLNGTSDEVLKHPELRSAMQPILRADFALCDKYEYVRRPRLSCPITAIGGLQDLKADRESLGAWREQTDASFRLHMLQGDHFFLRTNAAALQEIIVQSLSVTSVLPC